MQNILLFQTSQNILDLLDDGVSNSTTPVEPSKPLAPAPGGELLDLLGGLDTPAPTPVMNNANLLNNLLDGPTMTNNDNNSTINNTPGKF